jgi:hypothetical protein
MRSMLTVTALLFFNKTKHSFQYGCDNGRGNKDDDMGDDNNACRRGFHNSIYRDPFVRYVVYNIRA